MLLPSILTGVQRMFALGRFALGRIIVSSEGSAITLATRLLCEFVLCAYPSC
jgi:hypothetical protein